MDFKGTTDDLEGLRWGHSIAVEVLHDPMMHSARSDFDGVSYSVALGEMSEKGTIIR